MKKEKIKKLLNNSSLCRFRLNFDKNSSKFRINIEWFLSGAGSTRPAKGWRAEHKAARTLGIIMGKHEL